MTKASDNAFPSVLLTEGTEPSAPAAGKQRVYIDSTSHHLSRTDSSGTQVDLETNQAAAAAYTSRRLLAVNDNVTATANVNSTSYISLRMAEFYHDWDIFPATHFLITGFMQANEASQTVTLQLTQQASPTNPVSSGGDDLVVTNTQGVFTSGWIAVSDVVTGLTLMTIACKGSNGTVDWNSRWLDIAFKIV